MKKNITQLYQNVFKNLHIDPHWTIVLTSHLSSELKMQFYTASYGEFDFLQVAPTFFMLQ